MNLGASKSEAAELSREALHAVGLEPALFSQRSPFSLSGGEARRVAILEEQQKLAQEVKARAQEEARKRALAEAAGSPLAQARAWNGLAFLNERLGKYRASIDCAERAEVLARDIGDAGRGERIRALLLKGWAYYRLSDAAAVLALGDQARRLCLECGNRSGLATSHKLHGVAHLQLGHFQEADDCFQEGLRLYEDLGDRRNAAAMWSNLGECARSRGDHAAAEKLYEKALAAVRQIGHRESEAIYHTNLSAAQLGLKKYAQAEATLRETIALTDGANFCALSATYSFLGDALLGQGKLAEAREAAQRALALARQSESDLDLGTAWRVLGQVEAASDSGVDRLAANTSAAESAPNADSCFAESLRVFKKINAESEQAGTLRAWAEFELRNGRSGPGPPQTAPHRPPRRARPWVVRHRRAGPRGTGLGTGPRPGVGRVRVLRGRRRRRRSPAAQVGGHQRQRRGAGGGRAEGGRAGVAQVGQRADEHAERGAEREERTRGEVRAASTALQSTDPSSASLSCPARLASIHARFGGTDSQALPGGSGVGARR